MTVTLKVNGVHTDFKQWKFPAGEVGVQVPEISSHSKVQVWVTMPTSDDIFTCLNLIDAIGKQIHWYNIDVYMPYLPYGRQDRVCSTGESFALQVFAKVLTSVMFNKLVIFDAHSKESINQFGFCDTYVENKSQAECAKYLPRFDALIAPDKGAKDKVITHYQVSAFQTPVFTILKERKDGKVTYVDFPYDTIKGDVCVVDDLCDGGATFIALAEMLDRTQPNIGKLNLYVTHGIFSKGVSDLYKYYDTIYVHNLMNKMVEEAESVTVI
jgi:ribose-phosphate pyrophosphokinase